MIAPTSIKPYMEVLGSDGVHVGTVDRLEPGQVIRLTKDTKDAGGEDRFIPLAWIVHVEMKVHLKQSADEAMAQWQSH